MIKRLLQLVALLMLGGALLGVAWLATLPRSQPASAERIEATPERLARGAYLFNAVLGCPVCHSERDFTRFGAPPVAPFGRGRACARPGQPLPGLAEPGGMPGTICFRNITPHASGIGNWTDGEILRAIREGVNRDGDALFPIMPAFIFRSLSDEDARAVVAYLRTLEPVAHELPATAVNFPVNWLIRLLPEPLTQPVAGPDPADPIARGRYLATVARCSFCHSPRDRRTRQPIAGLEWAGGAPFQGRDGLMYSPNLTPHESGLGDMGVAEFIALFRRPATPVEDDISLMPWTYLGRMTDADLGAIHAYLQSVPPIEYRPQ